MDSSVCPLFGMDTVVGPTVFRKSLRSLARFVVAWVDLCHPGCPSPGPAPPPTGVWTVSKSRLGDGMGHRGGYKPRPLRTVPSPSLPQET